jgi:hypothetical protein
MNTYTALVNARTLRTAIHAPTCRVVVNKTRREGAWTLSAETAEQAASQFDVDNQTIERGLPRTTACACCRG